MTERLIEILVFLVYANFLAYLVQIGRREQLSGFGGWRLLVGGFALLVAGGLAGTIRGLFDIDGAGPLSKVLVLTEHVGGQLLGVLLIFAGFWRLLPHVGLERRRAVEELMRGREQAVRANQAKSDFLANVSHELRTPLNAILGFSELIRERGAGAKNAGGKKPSSAGKAEDVQSYAAMIHDCATDLLSIVNNILDISKIEAGRFELSESIFDPRRTLESAVRMMRHRIESKPLEFTVDIADDLPPLYADERVIKQSVLNLLTNAAKFTPESGAVRVEAAFDAEGGYVIQVADNGRGMTREEIDRALTRFGQVASQARDDQAGTGLGLPLVKDFTELHGGELNLESEMGVGTSIIIRLPALRARPAGKDDPGMSDSEAAASPARRILLAEDNMANKVLLKTVLEHAGHRVVAVENGKDVLAALTGEKFDLIIMDVQMPEMDGVEAARRIRRLPGAAADVPILALTGNIMAADRKQYLAAGMTAYLGKPVDPRALRGKVARITAGLPSAAGGGVEERE